MAVTSELTVPAPPTTESSVAATDKSLLGDYKLERFYPHVTWLALLRILSSQGGGTYALSGPRGAGKTWAMGRAGSWAEEQGGLLIPFPSPSEYEPTAFLASISEVVASGYERFYDTKTQATTRTAFRSYQRRLGLIYTLAYVFVLLAFYGVFRSSGFFDEHALRQFINPYFLLGVGGVIGCLLFFLKARREYRADREGLRLVKRKAEDLREKVRYAATLKESAEVGLQGTATGVVARLKRASERQLVERPTTLSSLIQAFREFVELMAGTIDGPVVIAVDELDKMSDPAKVAQLLRDIKGIFDIRGTTFLVSLSDEAARSLDLAGVRKRNEFNSSFYAVFTVPSLSPGQCLELLRRRVPSFPAELGMVASILGAGIPREVVRIAELISADHVRNKAASDAVSSALHTEVQAFLDEALAMFVDQAAPNAGAEQVALYTAIANMRLTNPTPQELTSALRYWSLNGASDAWRARFQEEWRRVLLRIAVDGLLIGCPANSDEFELMGRLQAVIANTASSAAVGLIALGACVSGPVFARSGGADPPPNEACLAAYLLSHGIERFRHEDFAGFAVVLDDESASAALDAFRQRGILHRQDIAGHATWWLSHEAKASLEAWRDQRR
jgi:hypothetical protein